MELEKKLEFYNFHWTDAQELIERHGRENLTRIVDGINSLPYSRSISAANSLRTAKDTSEIESVLAKYHNNQAKDELFIGIFTGTVASLLAFSPELSETVFNVSMTARQELIFGMSSFATYTLAVKSIFQDYFIHRGYSQAWARHPVSNSSE